MPAQLHSLPSEAWWVTAIFLGLVLLSGGRKRRKKKKDSSGVAILVILGGILIATGGGGAVPSVAHAVTGHHHGYHGTLGCSRLEGLWRAAGGPPSTAHLAAQVAMAESSGNQYATNRNTDGSTDIGFWQINDHAHPGMATYDPLGNARSAVALSHGGRDWRIWVTYQHGTQAGYC